MLDVRSTLTLASERLKSMLWFGLLKQMDESVDMFNTQLNDTIPLEFTSHSNKGKTTTILSMEDREKLAWLVPYDMWLYEYAKKLFAARYAHLARHVAYVPQSRPSMPRVTCVSTRYIITCETGPLGEAFYYHDSNAPSEHLVKFEGKVSIFKLVLYSK